MTGRVVVVGLGPGDPRLVSVAADEAIAAIADPLRAHHPPPERRPGRAGHVVRRALRAGRLASRRSTPAIVERAGGGGRRARARCCTPCRARRWSPSGRSSCCGPTPASRWRSCPVLSFLDLAWARLGIDPVGAGVRLIDGHRFAVEAAGQTGPAPGRPVRQRAGALRHQAGGRRRSRGDRAAAPRPARRGGHDRGLGRPGPGRRARPPHLPLDPGAGRAGRGRAGALRRAGPHPAGPLPLGPATDPPDPHPPPPRGDLRGARGHRRARRRPRRLRAPRGGARRPALPGGLPRHPGRRGGAVHPGRRGPRRARQAGRPPPARVRAARRAHAELGGAEEGREGPGQRHGRRSGQPAVAAVRLQAPEQGGFGGLRLERRGRCVAQDPRGARRAGGGHRR